MKTAKIKAPAKKSGQAPYEMSVFKVMLVRDSSLPLAGHSVETPATAYTVLSTFLLGADREHLVVLLTDCHGGFIGVHTASIGDLTSAIASPREIFKAAILANAAGIVVAHNHPSGDPKPSKDDIATTNDLIEAGKLLGICVLDHLIIGSDSRYFSIRQMKEF